MKQYNLNDFSEVNVNVSLLFSIVLFYVLNFAFFKKKKNKITHTSSWAEQLFLQQEHEYFVTATDRI